jgi:hypothetical protein
MGRRNRYQFHAEAGMRHPRFGDQQLHEVTMGELIAPLMPGARNGAFAPDTARNAGRQA